MKILQQKKKKTPLFLLIAIPGMIISWIGMAVFWIMRRKKKKTAEE